MTVTVGHITYTVLKTDSDELPYELRGPRGAHYSLMRNVPNPHMLFAINARRFGVVERLGWFTDQGGELRSVR